MEGVFKSEFKSATKSDRLKASLEAAAVRSSTVVSAGFLLSSNSALPFRCYRHRLEASTANRLSLWALLRLFSVSGSCSVFR